MVTENASGIFSRRLPKDIICRVQPKNLEFLKDTYYAFNVAPKDLPLLNRMDPENGCYITSYCGLGLNKYRYNMCGNGAGIDRVFGFNIGRKKIPRYDDDLRDQMRILCSYCGAFHRNFRRINIGRPKDVFAISKSWKVAYEKYRQAPPPLTLY